MLHGGAESKRRTFRLVRASLDLEPAAGSWRDVEFAIDENIRQLSLDIFGSRAAGRFAARSAEYDQDLSGNGRYR